MLGDQFGATSWFRMLAWLAMTGELPNKLVCGSNYYYYAGE
jgi:hypothetical protein